MTAGINTELHGGMIRNVCVHRLIHFSISTKIYGLT